MKLLSRIRSSKYLYIISDCKSALISFRLDKKIISILLKLNDILTEVLLIEDELKLNLYASNKVNDNQDKKKS